MRGAMGFVLLAHFHKEGTMENRFLSIWLAGLLASLETACISPEAGTDPNSGLTPVVSRAARFAVLDEFGELGSSPAPKAAVRAGTQDAIELGTLPLPKAEGQNLGAQAQTSLVSSGTPQLDPALQSSVPALSAPAPILTFEGLNNLDNANAFGFRVLPPDTVGDVGPNHYVQFVNLLFRVYDKSGNPLTPPTKLSSVFAPLGGDCAATDDGDPIVLYDHLADRWLLTEFSLPNFPLPPFHQCIAISKTGNPAGGYFLYDFVMPHNKLNDYPKLGLWPDAYYMTDNQFVFVPNPDRLVFAGGGAFAFDRDKMLKGDPAASFIYFDLELLDPSIGGMLPSDLDGKKPPGHTPNYFTYFTADEFGDAQDGLRIFEFRADFKKPMQTTFTERPESPIAVAAFDPTFNSQSGSCGPGVAGFTSRDDIPQPPLAGNPSASCNAKLDAIGDRVLHRQQYRHFEDRDFETLVLNHTVDVNFSPAASTDGHRAGVRVYELRRSLEDDGGVFTVHDQVTFAPGTDHRWMGSAAMDSSGNLAVGYSVSSAATFPSIRYTGRLATDTPDGQFLGEATLQAGAGSQANAASRWGDYSGLVVDPSDGCTFWYTTEYYKATNAQGGIPCSSTGTLSTACWSTRIGSFRFPSCGADD